MLLRISAPHFVAGYDIVSGQIAPIIRYMRGWRLMYIERYCKRKGWVLEIVRTEKYWPK